MQHEPKPSWVKEDQLLDVSSEQKIYEEGKHKNNLLMSDVASARRRAGDLP